MLLERLKQRAGDTPQPEVQIRADKDVRYEFVGRVVVDCQRAGIAKVAFITEPDRGSAVDAGGVGAMAINLNRSGDGEPMVDINTTPLIDVMLVLLIMLIITIPVQTHAVKLDMPQANPPPPTVQPAVVDRRDRFRRHDHLERHHHSRSRDAR